jgi:hypothetical protein
MPTRENVQLLEQLMQAAAALAETKRQVDRVEQDIRVTRKVLGMEEEEEGEESGVVRGKGKGKGKKVTNGTEAGADGGEGEGEEEEGEGDADADADGDGDEEMDAEGERATSVATSVRSTGRKKVKLSQRTVSHWLLLKYSCSTSARFRYLPSIHLRRTQPEVDGSGRRINDGRDSGQMCLLHIY